MSQSNAWTENDIPDLGGRIAVVTGANSGVGYATARALAAKNAAVILACRNEAKGQAAARQIEQEYPAAQVEYLPLDLADLGAVRRFAAQFNSRYERLDMLVNNAGIMAIPFARSADGFEMQFATNHLGHFALTGLLLERIVDTPGARVVTVSSGGHLFGRLDFENLNGEKGYNRTAAYAQSKLANLLFTYELNRRFERAGADALAAAAHPGWTATNLQAHWRMVRRLNPLIAQKPGMGALPILYAATAPAVRGGDYFGPNGWFELYGYPVRTSSSALSHDQALAARLWEVSEQLSGVRYGFDKLADL